MEAEFISITTSLLSEIGGCDASELPRLTTLDLHLRGKKKAKLRRIEGLSQVPNLLQLNLSYNVITKIEGLDRLVNLVELNLAENFISRIEGIEHLKCLERLNLSGNKIKRIPESISSLTSLVHFRIARNLLEELTDVRFLGKSTNLRYLRLDDNPIMQDENATSFIIFHIQHLISLNGTEISLQERNEARRQFASDEISDLRYIKGIVFYRAHVANQVWFIRLQIANEQHLMVKLKRDLQSSPERALLIGASSNQTGSDFNDANQLLAAKLQQINESEQRIASLKGRLNELQSLASREEDVSSPSEGHIQRLRSDANPTPSGVSSSANIRAEIAPIVPNSPQTPQSPMVESHVAHLHARVEKLAATVLSLENERNILAKQLEDQKATVATTKTLEQELFTCQNQLGEALRAAQEAQVQLRLRESDMKIMEDNFNRCVKESVLAQQKIASILEENKSLQSELLYFKSQESSRVSAAYIDGKNMEANGEIVRLRMLLEDVEGKHQYLSKELEERLRQIAALTDNLVKSQQEAERLKMQGTSYRTEAERRIQTAEEETASCRKMINDLMSDINSLRAERDQMSAALRRSERYEPTSYHKPSSAPRVYSPSTPANQDRNYLEAPTDSDDEQRRPSSRWNGSPSAKVHTMELTESFTTVNRRAAEIMAHTLLEEMKHANVYSTKAGSNAIAQLKEVCARVMLRLFASKLRENDQKSGYTVPPFHILDNEEELSRLVEQTCANIATIEDSESVKKEIEQLQVLANLEVMELPADF